ncbi:MAG TPA: DUF3108 domain-containing protein, partial [Candidatus Acidoferrales bacterium]|nr:DUF3108 domain-containing protein [Candidatus Acidoferrales bacterium]
GPFFWTPGGDRISARTGPIANTLQTQKLAASKAPSKVAAVPFRVGETLEYRLSWTSFVTAATVRLNVVERRNLYGWDSWHFRAVGSTDPPLRTLFAIDDQFDSYVDALTFAGHQYEAYLNELGRKDDNIMELTPQGSVPRGSVASVIVPPATRDPLGFLESLRAYDWEHYSELRVPVFDGKNLYDIQAIREAVDDKISISALKSDCVRVGIHVFESGKELEHIKIAIWLQSTGARMPLVIQADLPLGTFRLELSSFGETAGK